jgi:hypothetical protein
MMMMMMVVVMMMMMMMMIIIIIIIMLSSDNGDENKIYTSLQSYLFYTSCTFTYSLSLPGFQDLITATLYSYTKLMSLSNK